MQIHCAAFLFDLDGVLVDSRTVVERVCRAWAARLGVEPDALLRIAHGRRTRDTVRIVAPHVDAERLGAQRLGFDPASCIVFEDAPPGIAAGRAAGARVVALLTTHPDADLSGAAAVIPDFTRLSVRRDHDGYILSVLD